MEIAYPYADGQQACSYQPSMQAFQLNDFKVFSKVLNQDLKTLVCQGAVSVPFTINDCIKNYSTGIITDAEGECGCSGQKENHAVTIVGFG
jgi:hypothetical protein